jgi:general secretion pathway protein B
MSATPPAVEATPSAAPPASTRPATAPARAGGPQSLQELLLAGELELPPLRIDIHVFADTRDQRFVFINMAKYREGERLREGPVLETITGDGVILEYQGRRFSLARE